MKDNPLRKLGTLGQSIWLDYIRRDLIASNELRRLFEEDGLRGLPGPVHLREGDRRQP